ncbi:MAG: NUDIX hydrolase [bacterium]|nr:NUDIX hydrolase [bacterium]
MNGVIRPSSGMLSCNSVGVIVRNQEGEYCLLDRRRGVRAWAAPAGHIDEGEDPRVSVARELEEETGIRIETSAFAEVLRCDAYSPCGRGAEFHGWFVYDGGTVVKDRIELLEPEKHRGIGWFHPEEMRHLELEPVWRAFFKRLDII